MAILSPVLRQRFFDSSGNQLAGGFLWSFAAGTSTPLATYDDSGAENTNPVQLDSSGQAAVRLASAAYKFRLEDANSVEQYTVDNVDGAFLSLVATADQTIASGIILPNGKTISWVAGASITGATDGEITLNVPTGETVTLQVNAVTKASVSGTGLIVTGDATASGNVTAAGALISQVVTGTAPLTIASTTPVANLVASPTTYNAAGVQQVGVHAVIGQITLAGGTAIVTLSGAAVFTANTTYFVTATNNTATNAIRIVQTDATHFTLSSSGATDVVNWIAIGN